MQVVARQFIPCIKFFWREYFCIHIQWTTWPPKKVVCLNFFIPRPKITLFYIFDTKRQLKKTKVIVTLHIFYLDNTLPHLSWTLQKVTIIVFPMTANNFVHLACVAGVNGEGVRGRKLPFPFPPIRSLAPPPLPNACYAGYVHLEQFSIVCDWSEKLAPPTQPIRATLQENVN